MRWGVRDESTDDHSTLELCLKELKACQDLSTGPNFMVNITTTIMSLYVKSPVFFRNTETAPC